MRHTYWVIIPRLVILAPSSFPEIPAFPTHAHLHAPALFSMSNRLIWPLDCPVFSLGSPRRYSHSGQSLILQLCTSFRLPPLQSRHLAWMAAINSCGVGFVFTISPSPCVLLCCDFKFQKGKLFVSSSHFHAPIIMYLVERQYHVFILIHDLPRFRPLDIAARHIYEIPRYLRTQGIDKPCEFQPG